MYKSKIPLAAAGLPSALAPFLGGGTLYDSSCHSNARTLYCDTGCYIKIDERGALAGEAALGQAFHRLGLGVEVLDYLSLDRDYLVTRSAVGEDLTHAAVAPERLCELLAEALHRIHRHPVEGFPVSTRLQRYLDSAGGDSTGGFYDESVLMDRWRIASRGEAWAIMQASRSSLRQDTLIHGDACLPNVIFHEGRFSAFIDFNMAGAGDRHIDLYWVLWSLQYNLKTEQYADRFLEAYGRNNVEPEMLRVVAAFELFG